jgi:ORF6N domain.
MAEDKKKDEIAIIEINEEFMKQKLYEFRGCKVLLDADLAEVYGYELKAFNQQVKRNIERFQNDMMFQLSDNEVEYLRSQFVTANISSKSRSNPYVFTEQGVYMLMTVLKGGTCGKTKHCIGENFQKNERLHFRKSRSYWSEGNTSVKHGDS